MVGLPPGVFLKFQYETNLMFSPRLKSSFLISHKILIANTPKIESKLLFVKLKLYMLARV